MSATQSSEDLEQYPPVDLTVPQATLRTIVTGMVLGGVLSLCNIYSGLKIGWGFNMSITAALLGYAFWQVLGTRLGGRPFGLLENNINQTAASSGASVSSAGLVAPIPALAMITGQTLSWLPLAVWVFSVGMVGIFVAVGLRKQMLLVDKLPFPMGIATAETVSEMYAQGKEAMARVRVLLAGGFAAAALKLAVSVLKISKLGLPGSFAAKGALAGKVSSVSLKNLTFALDPSLLLPGVGFLIGMRACVSLLLGAVVAFGVLAPMALTNGWADPGAADKAWFGTINKWMLWPGVAMMVTASLTSFAFSWKSVLAAVTGTRLRGEAEAQDAKHELPKKWFLIGLGGVFLLSVTLQVSLFDITLWVAAVGVLLTFALAIVAARVSGETGITPVGPMGKVTQLMFGVIAPGDATANLMAANVTGGAASQAGDLLHDMKTGLLIGASPRFQAIAQMFGMLSGSLAGAAAYLVLVPDPKGQLLTDQWPAPAVAAWKAVAEILSKGLESMPEGALTAMYVAGAIGVVLAVVEKVAPKGARPYVLSPASIGLSMVIPAYYSIAIFLGGVVALVANKVSADWSKRFLVVIAAGMIAGESLMGIALALEKILNG